MSREPLAKSCESSEVEQKWCRFWEDEGLFVMTDLSGPYKGMDRFTCREKLVEQLSAEGYLEKVEDYQHNVERSQRLESNLNHLPLQ